jgi:hypothetical protein
MSENERERHPVIRTGERDVIPGELRYAIGYRDKFQCRWCGQNRNLQLDHLIPWSAGGADVDVNLRNLCGPCNERRSNFRTDEDVADVAALTFECVRCSGGDTDSTVTDAFCLLCGRLGATRADQLRNARRYVWAEEMSWGGFSMRLSISRAAGRWAFWSSANDRGALAASKSIPRDAAS